MNFLKKLFTTIRDRIISFFLNVFVYAKNEVEDTVEDAEKSIRKFLSEVAFKCTDCEVTAKRITKDLLLKYDYELENSDSEFSMQAVDFKNPKERIKLAFTFKHLDNVDTAKAQRAEDIVYLASLNEYKNKYETSTYDEEIEEVTRSIQAESVEEVDSLLSTDDLVVAQGSWSN